MHKKSEPFYRFAFLITLYVKLILLIAGKTL